MLGFDFLRKGNYSASSGPLRFQTQNDIVAAGYGQEAEGLGLSAFESLAVQSVGFEDGAPDPAVHVYLTRGSARQIRELPDAIAGVQIYAHKIGAINVRPEAPSSATNRGNLYERNGRVCCGSSCAPTSELSSGTLGALVRFPGSNDLYVLSNNHVLAGCNHVPKGQPILAPSNSDGRADISAPREIARHDQIFELRTGEPNFVPPVHVDAALAKVTNADIVSSWQGDRNGYDTPTTIGSPRARLRVKKYGRTTGFTVGEVESHVTTPFPIEYNAKDFKGKVWFEDVWIVRSISGSFALPGDSGSLVVSEDESESVGLVFAASRGGDLAFILPMSNVMTPFAGMQLVSNHG